MKIEKLAEQCFEDEHHDSFNISKFAILVAAETRARCIELVLAGSSMPMQTRTLEILQRDRKRIAALIEDDRL